MFSFSSALWLAAASAMITADISAAFSTAICESNGLKLRCVHQVICEGSLNTKLQCGWNEVINIHSVNYGKLDENANVDSQLKEPCPSTAAADTMANRCNGRDKCDVPFYDTLVFGDPCIDYHKCLEVYFSCGTLNKVCEKNGANIRCDAGDVIRIQRAQYKLHSKSDCSASHAVCTPPEPVVKLAEMCNGRNNCVIRADSDAFVNPCEETDKSLALSYSCIKALS